MFGRTNELRKSITSTLKQLVDKVYYKNAKSDTDYPYVTYYLRHNKDEHKYNYFLEVHVWTKDVKASENIADKIEELDGCSYSNEYHCFEFYLNSRNNVEDEVKEIQHVVLLFNLEYFDLKG